MNPAWVPLPAPGGPSRMTRIFPTLPLGACIAPLRCFAPLAVLLNHGPGGPSLPGTRGAYGFGGAGQQRSNAGQILRRIDSRRQRRIDLQDRDARPMPQSPQLLQLLGPFDRSRAQLPKALKEPCPVRVQADVTQRLQVGWPLIAGPAPAFALRASAGLPAMAPCAKAGLPASAASCNGEMFARPGNRGTREQQRQPGGVGDDLDDIRIEEFLQAAQRRRDRRAVAFGPRLKQARARTDGCRVDQRFVGLNVHDHVRRLKTQLLGGLREPVGARWMSDG